MTQDKTTSEPKRKPMRKGKFRVVLCYGSFVGFGLAAVALAWLATRIHAQNGAIGTFFRPGDEWLFGVFSFIFFLFAIGFLLIPTLWEQHPVLRPENAHSNEKLNAMKKRGARAFRKEAVRNAPVFQRRLIRFCLWAPYIILALLICLGILNDITTLPSALRSLDAAIGQYMPWLLLAIFIPFAVAYELLMRRAALNLEHENRRRELYPDTCPDCDYPIDTDHATPVCPECGLARTVQTSEPQV